MRSSGSRPAPARRPGESADAYLRRLEVRPDFVRLTGSYRVQDALREAQREAAEARRAAMRAGRDDRDAL